MTVPSSESPQDTLKRVRSDATFEMHMKGVYHGLRKIPDSLTSIIMTLGALIISVAYTIVINPTSGELKSVIISITSNGMNYSVTMLGFVLAGFTIFLSVTNKSFFIKLATLKHSKLRINYLKFTISLFYNVFLLFGILYFTFFILNSSLNDAAVIRYLKHNSFINHDIAEVFVFGYCIAMLALSISYLASSLVNIGRLVMRSIVEDLTESDVNGYPPN